MGIGKDCVDGDDDVDVDDGVCQGVRFRFVFSSFFWWR